MFILANLLTAAAQILDYFLAAYTLILLGRIVISWISIDAENPLARFLYAATEPVLERVRERLPIAARGFDFSPFIVWIAVIFLQRFLVRSLYDLARVFQ
jgi:YggT family protein